MPIEPFSSAQLSQTCECRSRMLFDFFCQIQSSSSTALLRYERRTVIMGNSSERSYLFTIQNFFIVCAGVPSAQRGRTSSPSSLTPLSRMSFKF